MSRSSTLALTILITARGGRTRTSRPAPLERGQARRPAGRAGRWPCRPASGPVLVHAGVALVTAPAT